MSQPPTGQRDRVGDASNPARSNLQPAGSGNVSSVGGSPSPTLGTGYTQEQLQLQQQLLNQRAQQQRQQLIATAVAVAGGPGVIPAGVMATPGAVINILQQGILALRDPILNAQQVLCQSNLPEEIRQQARRIFQDNKLYSQLMERKLSDLQRVAQVRSPAPQPTQPTLQQAQQNTLSLPPQAGTATGIIAAPGGQSPNTTFAAAPPNPSSVANTTANTPSGAPSTNIAANTAATATTQLSKAKPASKGKKAAAATTTPVAPLPMTTTPSASSKAGRPVIKPPAMSMQRMGSTGSTGGMMSAGLLPSSQPTTPGLGIRSQSGNGMAGHSTTTAATVNDVASANMASILPKRKLQELMTQVDPNERLAPEVEDILLEVADEFIESVTTFACRLAKHRKSDTLEVKDLQLHLERNWNIRLPGFAAEDARPTVRKPGGIDIHRQKLAAIHAAKQPRRTNTATSNATNTNTATATNIDNTTAGGGGNA